MTIRAAYGMYRGPGAACSTERRNTSPRHSGTRSAVSGANIANPWANYPRRKSHAHDLRAPGRWRVRPQHPVFSRRHLCELGLWRTSSPIYMNQWNLSIQRQVGKRLVVDRQLCWKQHDSHDQRRSISIPAVFLGLGPCTIQTAAGPVSYSTCSTTANQQRAAHPLYSKTRQQGQYYVDDRQ